MDPLLQAPRGLLVGAFVGCLILGFSRRVYLQKKKEKKKHNKNGELLSNEKDQWWSHLYWQGQARINIIRKSIGIYDSSNENGGFGDKSKHSTLSLSLAVNAFN